MKNKYIIYVLIPLVFFVWGLIFFKIFTQFDNDEKLGNNNVQVKFVKKKDTIDTFVIIANYRDPFLRQMLKQSKTESEGYNEAKLKNNEGFVKKAESLKMTELVKFPDIKYYGLISNQKNKVKVGLFKVNNKDFIWKEGEEYENVRIFKLFDDSVNIFFKNQKKTFRKNNKI